MLPCSIQEGVAAHGTFHNAEVETWNSERTARPGNEPGRVADGSAFRVPSSELDTVPARGYWRYRFERSVTQGDFPFE